LPWHIAILFLNPSTEIFPFGEKLSVNESSQFSSRFSKFLLFSDQVVDRSILFSLKNEFKY
jgi:hypothetical protein